MYLFWVNGRRGAWKNDSLAIPMSCKYSFVVETFSKLAK